MLLTIISIGHLCVFIYCIVCFNVLIQLLAATVNKWCYFKCVPRCFITILNYITTFWSHMIHIFIYKVAHITLYFHLSIFS